MKKKSHLCVGDEKWGRTTDNDGWRARVLEVTTEIRDDADGDFLLGYCCHILTDIENNIRIWMPYVKENRDAPDRGGTSVYHQESAVIDYALYLSEPQREAMWGLLSDAEGRDVGDLVTGNEIGLMKQDLLHRLYEGERDADVSRLRTVTMPVARKFIGEVSACVEQLLRQLPTPSGGNSFSLVKKVLS